MSQIDVCATHSMDKEHAQDAAEALSADLAEKFGIEYGWDGDVLNFERPGVDGQITIDEKEIHVQANLGFMLAMLKGPIEAEIARYLKEEFNCTV